MDSKIASRGFTLIASLMLLLLLSGISLGLLMMVNTESRAGGNDVENSLAYRSAEGGIEQMTSDLSALYTRLQSPTVADIAALNALRPINDPYVTYQEWNLNARTITNPDGTVSPAIAYRQISSGPNQGLYAQIQPIDLSIRAERKLGDEVRMLRTVEVALIPVFQFGVFSDSDLAFFNSPQLDFAGRVHTNGDLYLGVSNGTTLTFHDKITAYGNVIRMVLPNGNVVSGNDGNVNIPTGSNGCDPPVSACRPMSVNAGIYREGSVVLGPGTSAAAQNPNWPIGISKNAYNGWIIDGNYGNPGGTGVKPLTLPFVAGGAQPYEIIRRPPKVGQPATGADPSRLGTIAQIRVLLSDNQADLHLIGWNGDPTQDVPLCSVLAACPAGFAQNGIVINGNRYFFGNANTDPAGGKGFDANFVPPAAGLVSWPQVGGWLLVETRRADGSWRGVTQEWLSLGFARGLAVPVTPGTNSPGVTAVADHRNAILYFEQRADRNGDGILNNAGDVSTTMFDPAAAGNMSQYNWFPINLYDTREGEVRDWASGAAPGGAASCSPNGVMNAVELDVGNLKAWLANNGGTGPQVENSSQNGYILYFSDRRGEVPDPLAVAPEVVAPDVKGEYGFEDVINTPSGVAGTPDGAAEAAVTIQGVNRSPEDTNANGRLDRYGVANVGRAFGINTATDPYTTRIPNCFTTGRKNSVTGPRHALKLVDGAIGNLPIKNNVAPTPPGGFTVASENPVYIQGDYNSDGNDLTWTNPNAAEPAHSPAAVIADTVTLLSNSWQDSGIVGGNVGSFLHPTDATLYRPASTTHYRVAIAAGKTIAFPHPAWDTAAGGYYGTDGGLHNFLRFLEDWNGDILYYKGSLVSLYYSTYGTGTFKCCNYVVYRPPVRKYWFDPLFAQPANLPPGTPMFRDVNNLSYRQDFTPR